MNIFRMALVQIPNTNPNLNPNHSLLSSSHNEYLPRPFRPYRAGQSRPHTKQRAFRCLCCDGGAEHFGRTHASFSGHSSFLHDLMDKAGIDTNHAKVARENFCKEVHKLKSQAINSSTMNTCNVSCSLDLARAALEVSAEDDALVSHSPVPLPVDSYLERLTGMAMEFAGHHISPQEQTPEVVLRCLDDYLYGYKNFQRRSSSYTGYARDCYLNMVLTQRMGNPLMLALIYSEIINILHSWKVIDFTVNMELSEDDNSLPKPVVRREDDATNAPNILTYDRLLVGILTKLKQIYWPWKLLNGSTEGSEFLKAAAAACQGKHMSAGTPMQSLFPAPNNIMGSQIASARAANHRLQRGIWTSPSFGDMRRALSASERLVILGKDLKELRDYGILLYHCGLYGPSFTYLCAYKELMQDGDEFAQGTSGEVEASALENVMFRLRLILAEEERQDYPAAESSFETPFNDPW